MDEIQLIWEDIHDAEGSLASVEDEMREIELELGDNYEDSDRWNDLHHEMLEYENHISYLQHCLKDYE